ncbi:MAG: 3-deoxy-D-manno-octulosonic acid transferase [Candidatus Acidiferrales bacterium]
MLVLAPYFFLRGWRRGHPPSGFWERLGGVPSAIANRTQAAAYGAIWIHAVSVGEVLAAKPLLDGLKRADPDRPVFVSTTTDTGQALARERLSGSDGIFYFPLDWTVSVRRALRAIRPAAVIVMETEIWPNFLREARGARIPVIFANARISEKSFARFKKWEWLIGPMFRQALHDAELLLAQSPEDSQRLIDMGAPDGRVLVTGNLKYDAQPAEPNNFSKWLAAEIARQERWPVIVAGSVVAGEEEAVLGAYDTVQRQWRRTLLVLAPRKPDRFDDAARLVSEGGWKVVRRSEIRLDGPLDETADVILLDSIGELAALYSIADATFVGGSLVPAGGHNILEPAQFGRPPVFGPHMENFRQMADAFLDAKAGAQVSSGDALGTVWMQLIQDSAMREHIGAAAKAIAERNRGATERSLAQVESVFRRPHPDTRDSR